MRVGADRAGALTCRVVGCSLTLIEVAVHRALTGVVTGPRHRVDVPLDGRRLAPLPVSGHE